MSRRFNTKKFLKDVLNDRYVLSLAIKLYSILRWNQYRFLSKGFQELSVILEPSGFVTMKKYATNSAGLDRQYDDPNDVIKGRSYRMGVMRIVKYFIIPFLLILWAAPLMSQTPLLFPHKTTRRERVEKQIRRIRKVHERHERQANEQIYQLGVNLFFEGEMEKSIPYICQYIDYQDSVKMIPNNLLFLSEEERREFWGKYKVLYTEILPMIAHKTMNDSIVCKAYNAAILSKGILLNSSQSIDLLFDGIKEDSLRIVYDNYIRKRNDLKNSKNETIHVNTDSMEQVVEDLQRALMNNSFIQLYSILLLLKWEQVYNCLNEKEIAIEFVDYPIEHEDKMYIALVLQYGIKKPLLIPLFKESELPIRPSYPVVDEELVYNLTWRKLRPYLKEMNTVFFSPVGVLNRIALEYIPDEEGLPINWQYNMYRLSSTRELISAKETIGDTLVCSLWGDFNYTLEGKLDGVQIGNNKVVEKGAVRDLREAIKDDVVYLPMTRAEISNICNNAIQQGHKYTTYTGDKGSEIHFRGISGKKIDIIHIATHGFYYPPNDTLTTSDENEMLMRSGIIMAGINNIRRIDNPLIDTSNDGILTALEISHLDLSSTDLVTLSACKTGLGDITSEGIYGIQRAFKKAGVQSELVSLWDVDDEATSFFMKSFYRYYFESKHKLQSLRFAQQALTQYRGGKYNDRKYWSAFVLVDGINNQRARMSEMLTHNIHNINSLKIQQQNMLATWLKLEEECLRSESEDTQTPVERYKEDEEWELVPTNIEEEYGKRLDIIKQSLSEGVQDIRPTYGLE